MHPLMSEAEVRYRQRRLREQARRERMVRQPMSGARADDPIQPPLPGVFRLRTRLFGRGRARPSVNAVLDVLRLRARSGHLRVGTETTD
jgi:hypothetical protein